MSDAPRSWTVPCPVCKAPSGDPCTLILPTLIENPLRPPEPGWSHMGRIDASSRATWKAADV